MGAKRRTKKRETERMSDFSFKMMTILFGIIDFIFPRIKKRIRKFGIKEGMNVVDYGCGPGRYAIIFAELVGVKGNVYAVDIHDLAIKKVQQRIQRNNIRNIKPVLARGYDSKLPENIADVVCAIDMFFVIKKPKEFLAELKRITKKDGILVIDDGHQSRSITKKNILDSELWDIIEETSDHLKCKIR
jgi:ubiquinone/menaquinone biosynthesis C-methylase UbiE